MKLIIFYMLSQWRKALEEHGMKISRTKTEYLPFNANGGEMKMDEEVIKQVSSFKYLGSRIQSGWNAWRRLTGVLCDKKISARLKGKVYKTAVRPAMLYGSETWPMKRVHEKKVDVTEMRMLRWMLGVTKMDRIRNEYIRGTVKVTELSMKMLEKRINWFGHVLRRYEQYIGKQVMSMQVEGQRRRGKPKFRWRDKLNEDLCSKGLTVEDARNGKRWKELARNGDPI